MGLAQSALDLVKNPVQQIVFDCDWADFVDGGADEGVATYPDLIQAGWYLHMWVGEVITPFAGGAAADARVRLGNEITDNDYTSTSLGLSCDAAGEVQCGHVRIGSNNPQIRGANTDLLVTVKVHGGDTDFSSLTAGKVRLTLFLSKAIGH